jgi:hypothetical protein
LRFIKSSEDIGGRHSNPNRLPDTPDRIARQRERKELVAFLPELIRSGLNCLGTLPPPRWIGVLAGVA